MPFKHEGEHITRGIPAAQTYRATLGRELDNGTVVPCTANGEKAEFVFNDTVPASLNSSGLSTGFAVGLLSMRHSGGRGVPCLAGGAVPAGARVCVKMVNFTIDGVVVSLPVAIDEADGVAGNWVVAKCTMQSSSTAADTDWTVPSLRLEFLPQSEVYKVGDEDNGDVIIPFVVDLAGVVDGDVVTDYVPGFAFEMISLKFVVTDPVTTALKTTAIHAEIGATPVTGGVLTITSALATPDGANINATAITALNIGTAASAFSLVAAATTAFVEGAGTIYVRLRHV